MKMIVVITASVVKIIYPLLMRKRGRRNPKMWRTTLNKYHLIKRMPKGSILNLKRR